MNRECQRNQSSAAYAARSRRLARRALMIRIASASPLLLNVYATMSTRSLADRPSRRNRDSADECCRSGPSSASGSRKTVTASSNETPCFAALASALRGSHSNTHLVYTECATPVDGRSHQAMLLARRSLNGLRRRLVGLGSVRSDGPVALVTPPPHTREWQRGRHERLVTCARQRRRTGAHLVPREPLDRRVAQRLRQTDHKRKCQCDHV
jgi:hypothetical protein